jgi:pimeloyl-ACP methyl ester carboxylesterase
MNRKRIMAHARSFNTFGLFADHETDWLFKRTLEYASVQCAETGECLVAAHRIDPLDAGTWISEWADQGRKLDALGDESLAGGHPVSARGCFLRAMNYYRTAEYACAPDHPRFLELWEKSVATMAKALPLLAGRVERVWVPFGNWRLPGYFAAPDAGGTKRPTLVMAGGNDSSGEEMLMTGLRAALERDYNLFTFEYPGHRGTVHLYPDCVRRPDMEAPFAAAFDWLERRNEADERVALAGFSFGGYVAARVAAFEPRLKAVIADSPIVDFSELTAKGRKAASGRLPDRVFDAVVERRLRRSPILKSFFRYGAWTRGEDYSSYARIARLDYSAYTVRPYLSRIACPSLALAGAGEGEIMTRQAREYHAAISSRVKRLHIFTLETDGSDDHCQLDNITRGMQVMFDWLDEVLGR